MNGTLSIIGEKPWFIMFYVDGCPDPKIDCEKVNKTWKEFYIENQKNINIAKVDCRGEETRKIC